MLALAAPLLFAAQAAVLPDPATPGRGNAAIDVLHYDLALATAPPLTLVRADARIRVRVLEDTRALSLDLHDLLEVTEVQVNGVPAAFRHHRHDLVTRLPESADAGSELTLSIAYRGRLPRDASQGEPVGLLGDGVGLVSYLQPDGAHHWFPCNDHPSDKASYDVRLSVPFPSFAAATGELRGYAWTPGWHHFHWGTDLPVASYLVAAATGPFEVITREGNIPILDLALPGDGERVRRTLAPIGEMLAFLEERFGPYPFERYGHVFTHLPVGGLENQTMTVLGRMAGVNGDPALLMHEAAHQWFGDWVTPASWKGLWLSEGWATYAELLWLRHAEGERTERALRRAWRESTLHLARTESPWTLAQPDPEDLFDFPLVYDKGGMVLTLLGDYLGEDELFAATRAYLRAHAGGNVTTDGFRAALEESTGEDLAPFFAAWVEGNTVPDVETRLRVVRKSGKHHATVRVEQVQIGLWHPFVVDVLFTDDDGDHFEAARLRVDGRESELTVALDFRPTEVYVDPHRGTPVIGEVGLSGGTRR